MRKVMLLIMCGQAFAPPVFTQAVVSPVPYMVQGQVYTQLFDGLPGTGTFIMIGKGPFNLDNSPFSIPGLRGWQFSMPAGTATNAAFLVSTGSSTGNGVQSLGLTGNTDRAVGSLSTGSGIYSIGLLLTNSTGITLNSITLSFTAEQWRKGGSGNKNTWSFRYRTGMLTSIDALDMIDEPHFNFGSLITTTGAGSLNGNLPENRQGISYTLIGITWKPGEQLLLRWDDADETGSDDACAIDDLHFSAVQVEDMPSVINKPVTITTAHTIQLNALVNDNNAPTDIFVEYDTVNTFLSAKPLLPQPDHIDPGSGTTAVTVSAGAISPGVTYFYRLKATNRNGTVTGAIADFTSPAVLPVITTTLSGVPGLNTATLGVIIQSNGGTTITDKGIVWSLITEPVLPANKISMGIGNSDVQQTVGSLPQGSPVFARAYAINTVGTAYGNAISFTTQTNISSLVAVTANPTNALVVSFALRSAQPFIGPGIANFSLVTEGVDSASVVSVSGTGSVFTITVNTGKGDGTVKLIMANDEHIFPGVYNKPFAATSFYTIDRSPPSIYKVIIPDRSMKTGDTIPVTIFVKPEAGMLKIGGNIAGQLLLQAVKKNDSTYSTYFIVPNAGIDIVSTDAISVALTATDPVGNSCIYNTPIVQDNDALDTNRPFVSGLQIIADRIYKAGDTLLMIARFSEKIYVNQANGSPSLKITIGNTARQALYMSGSGTDSILFAYVILSTDEDSSGSKPATIITITNSSIKDEAGNNASLLLPAYQGNAIRVDGIAPKMTSLVVPPAKYYKEGDSLFFIVKFSEKIRINSIADTTILRISIGSSVKNMRLSGVDTQILRFSYVIQKNDLDKTGISLGTLTTSSVNTITDIAGNPCSLTIRNAGSLSNVKVDAVAPVFVTPGNTDLFACRNNSTIAISDALLAYDEEKGDTISWTITPLRAMQAVTQNAMTIVSNGSKLSPGKIYYNIAAMKNGSDTLLATVSDGINEIKKMIIIGIQAGIVNNQVLLPQYACSGSAANITGTLPGGGNGLYEYLWEYSIDSVNFSKVNGINTQKDIGSSQKLSLISWFRRTVMSGACIDTSAQVKIVPVKTGFWLGSFTNEWQNTNNWCSTIIPGPATDVFIPGNMANNPVITDTGSCHDLTIAGNGFLTVKGSLQITGTVLAGSSMLDITKGKLIAAGNVAQTIGDGILKDQTIRDLSVNNTAGLFLSDTLYLDGSLQLISGYLQTNNRLLLRHTGSIGPSAEGILIHGNVSIDHLIPGGKRGFRLLGHPLASGIGLQMIKDSIDITGSRGKEHGFSNTATNDPSAFWYNTLSTKDTFRIDDNWTAFSSTNGEGENAWKKNQGIRLLMRGKPGEGLDGKPAGDGNNNTYLPGAVILKFTGVVNTGDQEVLLQRSDSAGYNLIANPYASPIDLSMLSYGSSVSDHYWIWDPNQGAAGGYSAVPFQSSLILPAFGAFFVKATGSLNNSIVFTEHCKVKSTGSTKLPVISNFPDHHVELRLFSDSVFMDRVFLYHSDSARIGVDKFDAEKLMNSGVNFYSLSREKKMLSIDARPLSNTSFINLGLQTEKTGLFSIAIADSKLSSESTLLLHDKYLDQWMKLEKDSSYSFSVTSDTASSGNYRFEIAAKPEAVDTILSSKKIFSTVGPVPAFNEIKVFYSVVEKGPATLCIRDRYGIVLKTMPIDAKTNGQVTVLINDLIPGIYFIEIRVAKYIDSKKIIKL